MTTATRRVVRVLVAAACVALSAGTLGIATVNAAPSPATPVGCTTGALTSAIPASAGTVSSATPVTGGSYPIPGSTQTITGLPAFCDVQLTKNDGAGHGIQIAVWLPTTNWNGNFQGVGGGGYSCGISYPALAAAIQGGYASSSTNCGLTARQSQTGSFAANPDGTLNLNAVTDFASLGIHDAATVGKTVTAAFYADKPRYSYYNGCSTGGREGLMEAQRYPADYNGILAGAPAINWADFIPAEIWPQVVMHEENDELPVCKEQAFVNAEINACDAKDGIADGVIGDPADCDWNPDTLVGTVTPCGTITRADADVVAKILRGPVTSTGKSLWYGPEPGADLAALAGTTTTSGTTTANPQYLTLIYLDTWLHPDDPSWNWQDLTYANYQQLVDRSEATFDDVIGTRNPDLSAFRNLGGKLILWHGLADQLIFPQGTVNYYQRVENVMGGNAKTETFARLFLAPGVGHCGGGAGPAPADPLSALATWVQRGQAPNTILAASATATRPLCAYPLVARYKGHGSTNDPRNFGCARTRG